MLPTTEKLAVSLESIVFSNGDKIPLEPNSIVLIVGPNGSGKTTSLYDIADLLGQADRSFSSSKYVERQAIVVKDVAVRKRGTLDKVEAWLRENAYCGPSPGHGSEIKFRWLGQSCAMGEIATSWNSRRLQDLAGMMTLVVDVENRLKAARKSEAIEVFEEEPQHPLHVLLQHEEIELLVSRLFHEAFRKDLVLKRAGGKHNWLHIASRADLEGNPDRASSEYIKKLTKYPLIQEAGHGMQSFAGCLLHVLTSPAFVLLIDEPEVFLHPPHARILGNILTRESPGSQQLIIATHSADFIRGVIDARTKDVKVIRITREGDQNRAHELSPERIKALWADPILRFSNILDGLFHEMVIICEGDADCKFYSAVVDAVASKHKERPDLLFTWANGKHRLATVACALHGLNVPTRVVVDFDIFHEEQPLKSLVASLGGDWSSIKPDWQFIKQTVEQKIHRPVPADVKKAIDAILTAETGTGISERAVKQIRDTLRTPSVWEQLKLAGTGGVPSGQPTSRLNNLLNALKAIGIFVVDCGELERFCPSVGGKGPKWVSDVLTSKNLAVDSELEAARKFVQELVFHTVPNRASQPSENNTPVKPEPEKPLSFLKRLIP